MLPENSCGGQHFRESWLRKELSGRALLTMTYQRTLLDSEHSRLPIFTWFGKLEKLGSFRISRVEKKLWLLEKSCERRHFRENWPRKELSDRTSLTMTIGDSISNTKYFRSTTIGNYVSNTKYFRSTTIRNNICLKKYFRSSSIGNWNSQKCYINYLIYCFWFFFQMFFLKVTILGDQNWTSSCEY